MISTDEVKIKCDDGSLSSPVKQTKMITRAARSSRASAATSHDSTPKKEDICEEEVVAALDEVVKAETTEAKEEAIASSVETPPAETVLPATTKSKTEPMTEETPIAAQPEAPVEDKTEATVAEEAPAPVPSESVKSSKKRKLD